MDNKKWHKRFSTIFWWGLTILPWLYVLFVMVGALINLHNDTETLGSSEVYQYLVAVFNNCFNTSTFSPLVLRNLVLPSVTDAFYNLFDLLGLGNVYFISYTFSWMVCVQLYHLIFDVICWIFWWCHSLMERSYK